MLIYQGHVLWVPSTSDNGRNTLLLARGIKGTVEREGEGFQGYESERRDSTEYHVTRQRLPSGTFQAAAGGVPVVIAKP